MKKWICVVCLFSLLMMCLCLPISAETVAGEGMEEKQTFMLHDCDSLFGNFVIDRSDMTEGSGSVRFNFGSADSFACGVKFAPVDATGADTLALDIYLSSDNLMEGVSQLYFEATSSGVCDSAEICWPLHTIPSSVWHEGWNRVYCFFDDANYTDGNDGPFDISKVNFVRIYAFFEKSGLQGEVIKFDNIHLCETGGDQYTDLNLDAYTGDNKGVDVKISGQPVNPSPADRNKEITVTAGKKLGSTDTGDDEKQEPGSGCNAVVTAGAWMMLAAVAVGMPMLRKKEN